MYLGGRETNKHESKKTANTQGRSIKTKTPIFGMVARKGFAHAFVVKDAKSETLKPYIQQFCADNAHLFTDEFSRPLSMPCFGTFVFDPVIFFRACK